MAVSEFNVYVGANEAVKRIKDAMRNYGFIHTPELIDEDTRTVEGKTTVTLVYQKYYMRNENQAALVVIIDDFGDNTRVKCVSTAASKGAFFKLSWGAESEMIDVVRNAF